MNSAAQKGFTLLELMIVVIIISILAGIAYPAYLEQVRQTRRVDGKSAVLEVAMAQERYYTQKKEYTGTLGDLSIHATLKTGTSKDGYYALTLENISDTTFTVKATATATGSQINDTACSTMSMNQKNEKTALSAECW